MGVYRGVHTGEVHQKAAKDAKSGLKHGKSGEKEEKRCQRCACVCVR